MHTIPILWLSGLLTRAVKEGHWILLDEVNMANPETLECLSSLLDLDGSVCLYEKVYHILNKKLYFFKEILVMIRLEIQWY